VHILSSRSREATRLARPASSSPAARPWPCVTTAVTRSE